jgi:hypothetical protein
MVRSRFDEDHAGIRSALEEAAAEADRRRRLLRWGLTVLAGALLLSCLLLLDGQV